MTVFYFIIGLLWAWYVDNKLSQAGKPEQSDPVTPPEVQESFTCMERSVIFGINVLLWPIMYVFHLFKWE